MADGQLPYHDFTWAYGPGQPYLLAGAERAVRAIAARWRIVRVLVNGAVSVVAYLVLRRWAGEVPALAGALVTAAAMAQPLSANPFALALLFALVAVAAAGWEPPRPARGGRVHRADRRVAARLRRLRRSRVRRRARACSATDVRLRVYVAGATAGALLVYLPFLIAAGPADMWDALVATGLRDREYWTLPFPLEYDGGFELWPPGALAHDLKDLLSFYVPLLLVIGLGVGLRRGVHAPARAAAPVGRAARAGGCFFIYLRSRTDAFHETPLLVALALLLPLVAVATRRRVAVPALVVLALLGAYVVSNRANALFDPPDLERLRLDVADGVQAEPGDAAALPRAVAQVRELVPPDEPIYVVTRRSDLVRIGNPLFYVLADRPNVMDTDFDLQTSAGDQSRIVEQLEAAPPRAVVRWTDPDSARRETNERGEPSGSRLLDEYLARAYRERARFGYYVVLEPRT